MYTYDTPQKFIITYNIDIREDLVGDKERGEREVEIYEKYPRSG